MAKYTVELRTLLDDDYVRELIKKALSTYPMYTPFSNNEEVRAIIPTRQVLNEKLLNHYKYREIGFESIAEFIDMLEITMKEIMPYYNQMYNSVEIMALIDDPFGNVDVTETFSESRKGTSKENDKANNVSSANTTSTTESGVTSDGKSVESSTPNGVISTPAKSIDTITNADQVGWNKNHSSESGTATGTSNTNSTSTADKTGETSETVEHTFTKKGNQGVNTYAHDMIEFRTSIIDVTTKIIEDDRIKDLFLQVF